MQCKPDDKSQPWCLFWSHPDKARGGDHAGYPRHQVLKYRSRNPHHQLRSSMYKGEYKTLNFCRDQICSNVITNLNCIEMEPPQVIVRFKYGCTGCMSLVMINLKSL